MQKLKVRPTFTNNLGQKPRGRRVNYPIIIHSRTFFAAQPTLCAQKIGPIFYQLLPRVPSLKMCVFLYSVESSRWDVENVKNFIWFGFEFYESYLWRKFNGSSFYWLSRDTQNQFGALRAGSILSSEKMSEKETMAKRVEKKMKNDLR